MNVSVTPFSYEEDFSGDNAVRLDNKLIDIPIIERARAILALSSARDPR